MSSVLDRESRAKVVDREKTAERLLKSSARNSYDPDLDIDWDAPLDDTRYYMCPEQVSLYGTELWAGLSEAQRITLSKYETASIASAGIWFEMILMEFLLRDIYDPDPQSRRVQWSLTEIADECRHSLMFAKYLERLDIPQFKRAWHWNELGRVFKNFIGAPTSYAGILIAEEVLDRYQRSWMADERLAPLSRMVCRIHVLEEARHVAFAKQEVLERSAGLSWLGRQFHRLVISVVMDAIMASLIHPDCYRAVGLDPKVAKRAALANPNHQQTRKWSGEKLVELLNEAGLIGGPGTIFWRKNFLI